MMITVETQAQPTVRVEIRGCTVCGLCEAIAPAVFSVTDQTSVLRPEGRALWGAFLGEILDAAEACPSGAIYVERGI